MLSMAGLNVTRTIGNSLFPMVKKMLLQKPLDALFHNNQH